MSRRFLYYKVSVNLQPPESFSEINISRRTFNIYYLQSIWYWLPPLNIWLSVSLWNICYRSIFRPKRVNG